MESRFRPETPDVGLAVAQQLHGISPATAAFAAPQRGVAGDHVGTPGIGEARDVETHWKMVI